MLIISQLNWVLQQSDCVLETSQLSLVLQQVESCSTALAVEPSVTAVVLCATTFVVESCAWYAAEGSTAEEITSCFATAILSAVDAFTACFETS